MSKFGLGRGLGALIPQDESNSDEDYKDDDNKEVVDFKDEEIEDDGTEEWIDEEEQEDDFGKEIEEALKSELDGEELKTAGTRVLEIPVNDITPNPYQPRRKFDPEQLQELADSIKENGLLQPITVTAKNNGTYELVAGERRLEATKLLGLKVIPALVRDQELSNRQKLELALIENIQRADLNLIEQARAYKKLKHEFGLTLGDIGERVGKSRPAISNIMRLLQLPVEIQRAVIDGKLGEGHARAIVQVEDREKQFAFFNLILKKKLSTDQAFAIAREWSEKVKNRTPKRFEKDEELESMENKLKETLDAKRATVHFYPSGGGKVTISFYSRDDFKRLVDELSSIKID